MGIFFKNKQSYSTYSSTPSQSKLPTFRFEPGVLSSGNSLFAEAFCEDNTIYCRSTVGNSTNTFVIGYVSREGSTLQVQCEFDRGEIGRIHDDGEVCLSTLGLCNRGIKDRYFKAPPLKLMSVARAYNYSLEDMSTHNTIGSISGDKILAAAAFVCLIYECHQNNKYHDFYSA